MGNNQVVFLTVVMVALMVVLGEILYLSLFLQPVINQGTSYLYLPQKQDK